MRTQNETRVAEVWASVLDVDPADLFDGLAVASHGPALADYEGVVVVRREPGLHVSAPEEVVEVVADLVGGHLADGGAVGLLLDPVWWSTALPGWTVLGPSVHAHLDSAQRLPLAPDGLVRRVDPAALDTLRDACSPEEWWESGFSGDVPLAFALTDPDGTVVAAANLTDFAGEPTDVGVVTHPSYRGRGLGRLVAATAARHALDHHGLARWRALETNRASRAAADALGFEPWCRQLAVTSA